MGVAIRLNGVTKKFGTFAANKNISLAVEEGTIHALVGENGAGKSTLTNIIYGILRPTSGEIAIKGKAVRFSSPREAIDAGIGMVHQHFMLIPELTVAENIMLGNEECRLFSRIPLKRIRARIEKDAEAFGLGINPDEKVAQLSVGRQQRVEILKLLFRNASIMIFDEPTAVLTPSETEQFFTTLRSMRDKGKTILLITHKLDEVLAVADTVSVMRKGELIGTLKAASATKPELARMMVGRSVLLKVDNPPSQPGKTLLSLRNLGFITPNGEKMLDHLSLDLSAGEIYAIAGVEGNGQRELLQALRGLAPAGSTLSGEATLRGCSLIGKTPREITRMGVSHIPENRLGEGIILDYPVSSNLIFGRHQERSFHKGAGFDDAAIKSHNRMMIKEYDIRCISPELQPISALSGGNQQKVVVAREFNRPGISLLILAHPTRGVDIGAIEMIHKKIIDARLQGVAILLLSSELEEIVALATRVGCLFKGSIRHEFSRDEVALKRADEHEFIKEIGLHIT
ncbi:ABC transporter ATP-binding protein [Chlorobium sp. BLA1]|uniref:ABC transporter ATP-binding protein n=1 Tax=Candidatus Chlorobium masyuteum TaxID=2716876 RepID=UPI001423E0EF|nr:ABC transporter ATP-binding protein [Candidatus Chlorobium masyuteum]NHQ60509.1 ABC transporter ATP-binding protein [Candidatus Chlorobium masyuteum]NTU43912.1 ABC transporter ATP-binding protein [Chlorobiaceae bacterium]